jgi:hypothetical protein
MMSEITSRNTHLAKATPPGAGALPSSAVTSAFISLAPVERYHPDAQAA